MAINELRNSIFLNKRIPVMVLLISVLSTIIFFSDCAQEKATVDYLNHHDSVQYVGMATCAACHADKHNTFIHTGMGKSFAQASRDRSAADFHKQHVVYDSLNDLSYYPYWENDKLYIKEFRLKDKDTVHSLNVEIDHIVGSGQHTNSHLYSVNGFVFQAPLTYYTQEGKWDLPPGFENGNNTRFDRMLSVECMSCHNSMPQMQKGSDMRFQTIGNGIDCERCHGPGELHVKLRAQGKGVDVSEGIDPTIVNPAKLTAELQIDLCQRCHLQGLNILKEGKRFTDFKPGMRLSDVFNVYLPDYEGESKFDMANHAARFQESQCFIQSRGGTVTFNCISCHNPHLSVRETNRKVFNAKCLACHTSKQYTYSDFSGDKHGGNCVDCHMPAKNTADVLHVSVHDHKIAIPQDKQDAVGSLVGLYAVNDDEVSREEMARAYLEFWEKFDKNPFFLEQAREILDEQNVPKLEIKYHYLKRQFSKALEYVDQLEEMDHWTAYMVGACYAKTGRMKKALDYYSLSYRLDREDLKVALVYLRAELNHGSLEKASVEARKQIVDFPMNSVLNALYAEVLAKSGRLEEAVKFADLAKLYDPDALEVWEIQLNVNFLLKDADKVKYWADKILHKYPDHKDKSRIMTMLSRLHD